MLFFTYMHWKGVISMMYTVGQADLDYRRFDVTGVSRRAWTGQNVKIQVGRGTMMILGHSLHADSTLVILPYNRDNHIIPIHRKASLTLRELHTPIAKPPTKRVVS